MKTLLRQLTAKMILIVFSIAPLSLKAQTEQDALMMGKDNICIAGTYGYNSWTNYWEGTFKRDNDNIGRLSTSSAMLMVNYGATKNLNIIASLPYVYTKASRGTLNGLDGFQDVSFFVKWRPVKKQVGKQTVALFAVGGYSTPTNDYNVDFMPMCIGLGSNVFTGRLIADIQRNKSFATISGAYLFRSNVEIDRPAYYTDHQINSNEVKMPNAGNFQFRTGYRSKYIIAEAFLDNMTTFGGFDIRKNDMPFVSNKMNSTKAGLEGKYYLPKLPELGFHGNVWHTLAGRNVGQSTGFMLGASYIVHFKSKPKKD